MSKPKITYHFVAVPRALVRDTTVNDAALRLWAVLRDQGDGRPVTLHRDEIGALLGKGVDAVSDASRRLVDAGWLRVDHDPRRGPSKYTPLGDAATSLGIRHEVEADLPGPEGESASPLYRGSSNHKKGVEDARLRTYLERLVAENKDPAVLAQVAESLPPDWTFRDVIDAYRVAKGRSGRPTPANVHQDDPDTPQQREYRARVDAAWGPSGHKPLPTGSVHP